MTRQIGRMDINLKKPDMKHPICTIVLTSSPDKVVTIEAGKSVIAFTEVEPATVFLQRLKLQDSHFVHLFHHANDYVQWLQATVKAYPEATYLVLNPKIEDRQSSHIKLVDEIVRLKPFIQEG